MNYELAKELKDAGFPQKTIDGKWLYPIGKLSRAVAVYVPTLSELIEACGDNLECIVHDPVSEKKRVWYASTYPTSENDHVLITTGSNPEEAVAQLWIRLR